MPDYTTLSSQVDLFKTKVTALTSSTLSANDLVLLASALNTLAQSMGVNDILSATNDRITVLNATRDAAITSINASTNGSRLTTLEATDVSYGTRIGAVENYVSTAGGQISQLSSTVTGLDSAISPNVMSAWAVKTASYTAVNKDRLLVIPADGLIITLPLTPNQGDSVAIIDAVGTAATTNFTIARNGKPIQSLSEDLIVDVASASFTLTYYNATNGCRIS